MGQRVIERIDDNELLLHACCAPCSAAIIEWLLDNGVTPYIYYYNPNIYPLSEYERRKLESKRYAEGLGLRWFDGDYDHVGWLGCVEGLESEPERGARCELCFYLRLRSAAFECKRLGLRYFATTLGSSRWKDLSQISRAGVRASAEAGVSFWDQNWRICGLQERRNELLRENNFYNQRYCGCEFSY